MDAAAELIESRRNRRVEQAKRYGLILAIYTALRVGADLAQAESLDLSQLGPLIVSHGLGGCLVACVAFLSLDHPSPARPRRLEAGEEVLVRGFAHHQGHPGTLFLTTLGLSFEPTDPAQERFWVPRENLERIELGRFGIPVLSGYALLTVRSTDWDLPKFQIPKEIAPIWRRALEAEALLAD